MVESLVPASRTRVPCLSARVLVTNNRSTYDITEFEFRTAGPGRPDKKGSEGCIICSCLHLADLVNRRRYVPILGGILVGRFTILGHGLVVDDTDEMIAQVGGTVQFADTRAKEFGVVKHPGACVRYCSIKEEC